MLGKLGDDSIMTLGGDSPHVDYEAMWKRELGTDRVDKTGEWGRPGWLREGSRRGTDRVDKTGGA